jgi:transcriptional regulator with XRE-family HTH domain
MAERVNRVGPARARERLRTRLRQLRESCGLSADTVASKMYWSISKLNRIETGAVTISPVEVRALAAYYGVDDENEVGRLITLAVTSREQQWWNTQKLSREYQQYVAYESEARRVNSWHALYLPGLVQTEDYARALIAAIRGDDPDDDAVTARVEVRMTRQRTLLDRLDGPHPPRLVTAMDQSVLLRPVGDAHVMRAQLDHLLMLGKHTHIEFLLVPLGAPAHRGLGGPFEFLEFEDPEDPDVIFVESGTTDFIIKDAASAEHYRATIRDIRRVARSGEASLRALEELREQLGN